MGTPSQRRLNATSLLLLALAFVAAVVVGNLVFKGWRLDLTGNNLYTLSDGTKSILKKIEEPINLYFYFSDQATENLPSLRGYANRVREMLEEFESVADGKINLHVIDPQPFSVDEDRAAQFGLQGIDTAASPDPIYMGLAGTNSVDDEEIIPFFQPDKEQFLEYDIARLVGALSQAERTVIGLISGISMSGDFNPQTQQMQSPWIVYQQAGQLFDIRNLGPDLDEIADDIGLLWIVQPKGLADATLYAIDQFVMHGGKALIFVDPLAETDPAPAPQGMTGMPPQGQSSDLPDLFDAWGIEFSTDQVVADEGLALRISSPMSGRPVLHPGMLGITANQTNSSDVVTADLEVINIGTAGRLQFDDDSPLTVEPLITSSERATTIPVAKFRFLPDPSTLLNDFTPSGEKYIIAARLSGTLPSAFPDGPPGAGEEGHPGESNGSANVIVVADVDLLSDRMWVQVQSFFGQQMATAFADNGTFVTNALENLSGSNDLIGVRSRASYSRPFTKVDELRVAAQARFQETEQRLQRELDETERRLTELQSSREDTGNILMTEEQQAEIDRFIDRRAEIRQELRAVQRDLDKNIERLGTILKSINIALVPLLLTLFILFAVWRRNRRQPA